MNPLKLRRYSTILLACQFTLLGSIPASATNMVMTTYDPIPTVVVGPPKYVEYPQPLCSKCKLLAQRETTATGETVGLLSVDYDDEIFASFAGRIELTMLLIDDTKRTETIFDVTLVEGELVTWTLPPRTNFSWLDVENLWVELVPAE